MKKALFAIILSVSLPAVRAQAPAYDLIIRNGRIMDGSGNPWFRADIGILNGKIAAIGNLSRANATKMITWPNWRADAETAPSVIS